MQVSNISLSLSAPRGATGINLPTLPALNTLTARGLFSTVRMYPGYTGNLIEAYFNGVAHEVPMVASGFMDNADLLAWWAGQPGGGNYPSGPYPRIRTYRNQHPTLTGDLQQTSETLMHVLDPNNIKSDGYWPASNNGFNARATDASGGVLSGITVEQNTQYASTAGSMASNTGNHSLALVIGGIGNLGNAGTATPQNSIVGMFHSTPANRWTLRSGDTDWAQRYGYGFLFDATKSFPAAGSFLRARLNRQVVLISQATTLATIDGQAAPVSNIRINGLQAESYTVGTARASVPTANGFLKLGSNASGTAASGDAFEFYGMVLFSNSLINDTQGDQRAIIENWLISLFNVRTSYSYQLACVTSSSGAYRANVGLGVAHDLANRLRDVPISVEWYGHANAGSSLVTDIEPNRAFISAVKSAGMTKTFAWVQVRSDLTNGTTGAAYYTASVSLIARFNTDTWTNSFLSDYFPSLSTGATTQVNFDIERAAYNVSVNNAANQVANGYTAISPDSIPQLATFTNFTYFDDNPPAQHPRGGPAGGGGLIAAQIETAIRAKLP